MLTYYSRCTLKRTFPFFLVFVFALSFLSFILQPIVAEELKIKDDDYPYYQKSYGTYRVSQDVDPWNFYYRECTSYVAWKLNNNNGVYFTNQYLGVSAWGNAESWGTVAKSLNIPVNLNPAVGSVAWWQGGHVAWVSDVKGDIVTIKEYNNTGDGRAPGTYCSRDIKKLDVTGYIHIKDIDYENNALRTSATISNGKYALVTDAGGKNYAIDIRNGSKVNTGIAQIWEWDKNNINQQFKFEKQSDGTYKITALVSGKVLDVKDVLKTDRVIIHQWDWVNGLNQKWIIVDAGGGYYNLISKNSGKYITVTDNKFSNGTELRQFGSDNSQSQKFKLVSLDKTTKLSNGTYFVKYAANPSRVLNIYTATTPKSFDEVTLAKLDKNDIAEQWTLESIDDYYIIHSSEYSIVLNVFNENKAVNNDNVNITKYFPSDKCQQWKIESAGNDKYILRSKMNLGLVLAINGMYKNILEDVRLQNYTGADAQKWIFEKK